MSHVVDRYAPSPTSDLHVGNLRTALAGWLLARASGGKWLLRVEDLDAERVEAAPGAAGRHLSDLRALGMAWDGEPVWQSERSDAYADALVRLDGQVYECFCTRREIAGAASAPHGAHLHYPGTCARLSSEQAARRHRVRPGALRIRSEGASFTVTDVHAGPVTDVVDDFVLVRADGVPAYNLAVVVDDIFQGVTRVTRAEDLLSSAPRQAWLAQRLGAAPPEYAHVGLVITPDGERLAKRHASATLTDLAASGHSPADVVSLLSDSLGLGPCRTVEEALGAMPREGLPGEEFWAAALWDGTRFAAPGGARIELGPQFVS